MTGEIPQLTDTPELIIKSSEEDNPELLSPPVSENARIQFKGMDHKEKIRAEYLSEMAWGIPRRHIDMFYIPVLLSIPIDEEIEYEVIEYIKEKSLLGVERGVVYKPKRLLGMFLNLVSNEYGGDISQRNLKEQQYENYMEQLIELEEQLFVLIHQITDTIQYCTSENIAEKDCPKLQQFLKNKEDLDKKKEQVKKNIQSYS